ncbi:hypothetical protein DAPPUDRAFT_300614 [Daphnia pulex]|uniref:Uncharacterized protein n=1 Tax=Daphnia pulex TaxID=6669 RepID=E9HZU3_DAPPU|nr:hypothetical protein DAPPUDRAFT_300614 [Daphnia pulex]|eukprot:EFX62737.1 hypothetical protein DAPPUDRAFT_300614 [Daphnia pulex]
MAESIEKRTSSINRTAQLVRSSTVNEITEKDPLAVDFIQIKNYDTQDRTSTCIRSGPADPNTDVVLSEHLSEPFNSARALSMMRQNRDVATGPLTPPLPTVGLPTVLSVDARVQKKSTDARRRKGNVVRVRTTGDGECDKRKTQSKSFAREDEMKTNNKMYTEANETRLNANDGIAKVFSTSRHYSQLIKKGQPNVYLLHAEETSVGEDFRCFDIGQPEGTPPLFGMRNHKVIILMGASGCGKSTLINGMVNYILGVKWDDPFRFKCVRETTAKNQAHKHVYQEFEWRLTPVKITMTLKDMKAEYESNYDRKVTAEQLLADNLEEMNMMAKWKVFSLLEQVGINAHSLESTVLRSNALTPSDFLSLMRSRVSEEQAPGYLTRLETLTELQNCLAADASASALYKTTHSIPDQTHRLSKTDGATQKVNYGFTTSQHGNNADDYRMATINTKGSATQIYYNKKEQSLKVAEKELATTQQEFQTK